MNTIESEKGSVPFKSADARENHWLAVLNALPDLLFELDLNGRYLDYHSPRTDLLAMPRELFLGKTLHEVMPGATADQCMVALQEAAEHGFSHGQQIELALPGGISWFELSISRKDNGPRQPATLIVLSRDITQRVLAERKLQRLTRLYAALNQCNQAIVRCHDTQALFPLICANAVAHGGLMMAWIGVPDPRRQWLLPVASAGVGTEYLSGIQISADPQAPSGQGPSGRALREGQPSWCQDFARDPATQAWQQRAAHYGWGASAALPLHCGGQVEGVLSVYAQEPGAFDEAAQALLLEMATDVSHALDRFADEHRRERVQAALQDSEERYRQAFQTSPDAVNISRRADGQLLDVNPGFERMTGWSREEAIGKTTVELQLWHHAQDRQRLLDQLDSLGQCSNLDALFRRKDGSVLSGLLSAAPVRLHGVDCVLSILRDITEKKTYDERIAQLVHFDQLTGLPNRNQLKERFEFLRGLAQRSGDSLALMFLDLDHFKNINDTLGHSVGDRLLVAVSQRLSALLRAGDTLSRMGGDEFILLLPAANEESASQIALQMLAAAAEPYRIDGDELVVTLSIGVALYPLDGLDFDTLAKNADAAMYRVKQASHNNFCFFTQEMQAHSARTLRLSNALHYALARGELQLHYQPQIALADGRLVGAEALLRWQHPELGAIAPTEFIPVAEDSGQILLIGEWVLRTAVAQFKRWFDAGMAPMVVAVNLSAVQFRHPDLLSLVKRILQEEGLAPQYLELELTEAMAMSDPLAAIALMNQLHAHGVCMSIDDFGTGYSSLSYLKKFNVAKLKIDQSFVRDISDDPDDKAIVTAVIHLARSLGLKTIAEGVETASQLAYLRQQGCDEVQGYYFSRPLPAEQFEAFARARTLVP